MVGAKDECHSEPGISADCIRAVEFPKLDVILNDPGSFHGLVLESFNMHADGTEYISSLEEYIKSLNYICEYCGLDAFTYDEVVELWIGGVNFGEFYLMCKELFQSLHRALNSELESSVATFQNTD